MKKVIGALFSLILVSVSFACFMDDIFVTENASGDVSPEVPTEVFTATPTETLIESLTEEPIPSFTDAYTEAPTESPTAEPEITAEPTTHCEHYILNTNTKKFHVPGCRCIIRMNECNKKDYYGSREDLIAMGYSPCSVCHP